MEPSDKLRQKVASRSTWVSIIVNLLVSTIQLFVGFISHSSALIADATHSYADLFSDFIVLFINKHGNKAPDQNHPYGHKRYETAASLMLGLVLIGVAISILIHAIGQVLNPSHHLVSWWALSVAIFTLLSKELLFRYMLWQANLVRSSLLIANAWHARSDALSSLMVAIGIFGQLLGVEHADTIAAALVAGMIGKMGISFAWEALQILMDRAPSTEITDKIRQALAQTEGVLKVGKFLVRQSGDFYFVEANLYMNAYITLEQAHDIGVIATQAAKKAVPEIEGMTLHFEPHTHHHDEL